MGRLSKFQKVLVGLGTVSGVAAYYYTKSPQGTTVSASWTTNYEPPPYARWDDNWDHRSPKFMVSARKRRDSTSSGDKEDPDSDLIKPKALRHLILIRHGQYNVDGKTDSERVLTTLGRVQADYTGKRLRELGLPLVDIVKSTMSRAQETGDIISKSLPDIPVYHCDLLREGAPVPPEPPLGSWKQEMYFYVDGARIEAAFRKYFHRAEPEQKEDSYTVLVCHANVIRYFVCRALQFPSEGWLRMSLNHASITWITITPSGRVILRCLGDSGHMPPDVITSR